MYFSTMYCNCDSNIKWAMYLNYMYMYSTYQTKQITIIAMTASIMRNMTTKMGTRMYARFNGVDISGIKEKKL